MIYLASPFTHRDPAIQHLRYVAVRKAALTLMQRGEQVFAPVVYGYQFPELSGTYEQWGRFCEYMIEKCSVFTIYKIDGWRESSGLNREWPYAISIGKPCVELTPETLETAEFTQ